MDDSDNLTFEQLMARLEKYVLQLEEGGISLDKAADLYEEAMEMATLASPILNSKKITETYESRIVKEISASVI